MAATIPVPFGTYAYGTQPYGFVPAPPLPQPFDCPSVFLTSKELSYELTSQPVSELIGALRPELIGKACS